MRVSLHHVCGYTINVNRHIIRLNQFSRDSVLEMTQVTNRFGILEVSDP
jgi:hypothetical protein